MIVICLHASAQKSPEKGNRKAKNKNWCLCYQRCFHQEFPIRHLPKFNAKVNKGKNGQGEIFTNFYASTPSVYLSFLSHKKDSSFILFFAYVSHGWTEIDNKIKHTSVRVYWFTWPTTIKASF